MTIAAIRLRERTDSTAADCEASILDAERSLEERILCRIETTNYDARTFWQGEEDAGLLRDCAGPELKAGVLTGLDAKTGWPLHLGLVVLMNEPTSEALAQHLHRAAQDPESVIASFAAAQLKQRGLPAAATVATLV